MTIQFEQAYFGLLENQWSFSLTSFFVLVLASIFSFNRIHAAKAVKVPFYGQDANDSNAQKKRWMSDSINLIQEGYNKFHGAFQVWTTEGSQIVVPPKYVEELRSVPETTITTALPFAVQSHYTMPAMTGHDSLLNRIVKIQLNKHMARMIPVLKEELDHAISVELPVGEDWTTFVMYSQMVRIICRVTGRIFVGPQMNRNEEWIQTSTTFTRDAFAGATELKTWSWWLRPFCRFFIPEFIRIRKHNEVARKFIDPIVRKRSREEKLEGYTKPDDSIEWVRDSLSANAKNDLAYQANFQLVIGAASIHTTTQMITNTIYDLLARPEYIEILREEAKAALSEHGGAYVADSLNKMKKMDSFVKESQRFNAIPTSWNRRVLKPITVSDGVHFPAGTLLMSPSMAISADDNVYENASEFDGLRFYKLGQRSAADENKFLFTSTSVNMMHFGGGRHACPGRFFASHEIKMIISTLILNFDLKFKEGQTTRPKGILRMLSYMPDPTREICFRKLKA